MGSARVAMTIEEMVLEKLRRLPPEKQKEVLEFAESLEQTNGCAAWKGSGRTWTSTLRKKTFPKLAAKCGATSRETSSCERGPGYAFGDLVSPFQPLQGFQR